MKIEFTDEFNKELKKLAKKYRTLEDDFEVLKSAIIASPEGNGTKHWNLITKAKEASVFKVRLMCKCIGGGKFRVIYKYDKNKVVILFIEMYYKGNKVNEEKARIKKYL